MEVVVEDWVFPESHHSKPLPATRSGPVCTLHQEPVRVSVPVFGAIKSHFLLILPGLRTFSNGFVEERIFLPALPSSGSSTGFDVRL